MGRRPGRAAWPDPDSGRHSSQSTAVAIPGPHLGRSVLRARRVRPRWAPLHPIGFKDVLAMVLRAARLRRRRPRSPHAMGARQLILGVSIALTFSRSAYVKHRCRIAGPDRGAGLAAVRPSVSESWSWPPCSSRNVPASVRHDRSLFRNVSNDQNIYSRTGSYDLAFEFIAKAPLFGRGLGTFLPKYRIFDNRYLAAGDDDGGHACGYHGCSLRDPGRLAAARGRTDPIAGCRPGAAASVAAGAVSLTAFDAFAFPMTMGTLFLVLGVGCRCRLTGRSCGLPACSDGVMTPWSRGPGRGGRGEGGADGLIASWAAAGLAPDRPQSQRRCRA